MDGFNNYFIVGTDDFALKDTMNGVVLGELVRCKDCTKYKHWECPIEQAGYRPKEDGYCFDAERKPDHD